MENVRLLEQLPYFVEWGNKSWEQLSKIVINELRKENYIKRKKLLDIG